MARIAVGLIIGALLVVGCSSGGAGDGSEGTTSSIAGTTVTVVPPSTKPSTTTTLRPPVPPETLFSMTRAEMLEASAPIMDTAQTIARALASGDRQMLVSAFEPDAFVIDPVVPSLRPPIGSWFYIYQRLCTESETTAIFINLSGSASTAVCSDFFEGLLEDPPPTTWFLPHVLMPDALGAVLLNRMDAEAAASYPAETSDAIGFRPSREKNVARMAETAQRFAPLFQAAWESGDGETIAALYADEGVRIDGLAGLGDETGSTRAWIEAFTRDYDEIEIEIELLVASAPGPGAEYTMTLGAGTETCVMRMVSAWELDENHRIVREYVYYHPDSVLACGWETP